nr:acetylserotonin O-methyltransferase [Spelaeicoccus albus]
MIGGFQVSQAVYVAAKLDVPTVLGDGPMTVRDLAGCCGAQEPQLRRLIRTLTSLGLFTMDNETVSLSPLGATLSRTEPESLYGLACMWMETHYGPFSELLHTLRTGEPGADKFYGKPFFDWAAEDAHRTEQFSGAMRAITEVLRKGMFDGYQPPAGDVVADIGAADGSVLIDLLEKDRELRGIAFDLPSVRADTVRSVAAHGYQDRIEVVAGDFFSQVPTAQIYLLSYILHDWDDDSCARILQSVAEAGGPGARLLIVETVVPDNSDPHLSKMIDLTMLGVVTGQERSAADYVALLDCAGITLDRIVATSTAFSIIEATVRDPRNVEISSASTQPTNRMLTK